MKKNILLATAILIAGSLNATVYTVDNNEGSSADYELLQTAIDIASATDTIYISGSPYTYDDATIRLNKQLTLIGPGFFLGENDNTQSSNQTAKIYDLDIGEGADSSIVMGLDFITSGRDLEVSDTKRDGSNGTKAPKNVTLKRNLIPYLRLHDAISILIEQNYFYKSGANLYIGSNVSGITIQNNIFARANGYNIAGGNYELSNTVIRNNILSDGLYHIDGVEISNNIFTSDGLKDCDNNTLKNNVFTKASEEAIPTGSDGNTTIDNVFSVNESDLFVEATQEVDNDFILKAGSPAEGAGIDGIDAGAYGGANSYKLSGLPPIPSVYEVSTNGIGTKETGLSVTIKAKSNN